MWRHLSFLLRNMKESEIVNEGELTGSKAFSKRDLWCVFVYVFVYGFVFFPKDKGVTMIIFCNRKSTFSEYCSFYCSLRQNKAKKMFYSMDGFSSELEKQWKERRPIFQEWT